MRKIACVGLFAFALLATNSLRAQLQLSSVDLAAIEATTPLSADEMPSFGTFYSAGNPNYPPLPTDISGSPGWSLGGGIYLLDDLDALSPGSGFSAMDDSEPPYPGGDGSPGGSIFNGESFPTNGLWLQITNISTKLSMRI